MAYIELGAVGGSRAVEGDHLGTEKVLAILDAAGNLDGVLSSAVDDRFGCPGATAQPGLLNLEPEGDKTLAAETLCE